MWRAGAGGRVKACDSGLVPLEVIKAKAALHVSDWDLDDVGDAGPRVLEWMWPTSRPSPVSSI